MNWPLNYHSRFRRAFQLVYMDFGKRLQIFVFCKLPRSHTLTLCIFSLQKFDFISDSWLTFLAHSLSIFGLALRSQNQDFVIPQTPVLYRYNEHPPPKNQLSGDYKLQQINNMCSIHPCTQLYINYFSRVPRSSQKVDRIYTIIQILSLKHYVSFLNPQF